MTRLYLVTILAETLLFDKVTFFSSFGFVWQKGFWSNSFDSPIYWTSVSWKENYSEVEMTNTTTYKSKYFVQMSTNSTKYFDGKKILLRYFFSLTIFRMILGNLLSLWIDWVEIVFNMSWDVTIITIIQMIHQGILTIIVIAIMHLEIINQRN